MNKRNFYKWHRILGLIALVPVMFWTMSGVTHPFMSNWFRPFIAKETFAPVAQNKINPSLSVQEVMDKNGLKELRNFGIVKFDKGSYYQMLGKDSVCNYYSVTDGKLLPNGDKSYAIYLARYFTQDSVSALKNVRLQTQFDGQYQPVNHLLPIWKVAFDRTDGMDVYIETTQSRMGTFNNHTRKTLLWVFEQFHTWDFLAAIGGDYFRLVVLFILVSVMLLALITGLTVYGLYWKSFKTVRQKRKESGADDKRFIHRYHRQIGLIVSFIMLLFVTSAAFHLYVKLYNTNLEKKPYEQLIKRDQLGLSNLQLPVADSIIHKISLADFSGHVYYQITNNKKQVLYFDAANGRELPNGDQQYAAYLSGYYGEGGLPVSINRITEFDNDYGFINKRLPVQKVSYANGETRYIETTTAKLATKVAPIDRVEGLSFIFLHKFFWMTWAGKDIRDIVSMLCALGVLVVALLGFVSFIKNK